MTGLCRGVRRSRARVRHCGPGPGRRGAVTPGLGGGALSTGFNGAASYLALLNPEVFDRMRFWEAGTLADRSEGTVATIASFILVGVVLALVLGRSLNVLALGDDLANAVGPASR